MKRIHSFLHKAAALVILVMLTVSMAACSDSDEPNDNPADKPDVKRVVLLYAVNNSSLSGDYPYDRQEMLDAFKNIDCSKYQLLVYSHYAGQECGVYKIVKENGVPEFELVRGYSRAVNSTDPKRISEVIDYALSLYPEADYSLFFWGHGSSWQYEENSYRLASPQQRAYGGETNPSGGNALWINVDQLADAIPDKRFDAIWFDVCLMAGIENIYQLRDKCDYMIAYPTEVYADGMRYDLVLPHLLRSTPDWRGAAKTFFDAYNDVGDAVTVSFIDMSKLEDFADVARKVYESGDVRPTRSLLNDYTSNNLINIGYEHCYDLGQMLRLTAKANGAESLVGEIDRALGQLVIYHAESAKNFNLRPWKYPDALSGISTNLYDGGDSAEDEYYRSLDWFKRVY